jgi:hypothetical protein
MVLYPNITMLFADLLKETVEKVTIRYPGGELLLPLPKYYKLTKKEDDLIKDLTRNLISPDSLFSTYRDDFGSEAFEKAAKEFRDYDRMSADTCQALTEDNALAFSKFLEDMETYRLNISAIQGTAMLSRLELSDNLEYLLSTLKEKSNKNLLAALVEFYYSEVDGSPYSYEFPNEKSD